MAIETLQQGEKIFQEVRTVNFRKEEFAYVHSGIIDSDGEMWTTSQMDEVNTSQVYNQYRFKHGIPFPDEISAIREHYGLSAAKMSQILGFGINQYRMYEDGEVPSVSNARTIMAAREKAVFLSFIEASKGEIGEHEYIRVKNKVLHADGDYTSVNHPSEYTGFRSMSLTKILNVVQFFIAKIGATFITKMNKLLFYVDFLHYRRYGYGITGITYKALPYGPVPENWGTLYGSLPGVEMEEYVYPNGLSGVRLESAINNTQAFTESELDAVETVCKLFEATSAGEISQISHCEKGWRDNQQNRGRISYQFAFDLNYE